jgi:hypothetical protein
MASPVRLLLGCRVSTRRPGRIPGRHRAALGSAVVFHACRKDTIDRHFVRSRPRAAGLTSAEIHPRILLRRHKKIGDRTA